MRVTENVSPLPKVPLGTEMVIWQLHSDDLTSDPSFQQIVAHDALRCLCLLRSWSTESIVGFFSPPFPQGGRLISSEPPERGKQEVKA